MSFRIVPVLVLVVLVWSWPRDAGAADPLGVEVGWCEPAAFEDQPADPLGKHSTFGHALTKRKLRIQFIYTIPPVPLPYPPYVEQKKLDAIAATHEVQICYLTKDGEPVCPRGPGGAPDPNWTVYDADWGDWGVKPSLATVHIEGNATSDDPYVSHELMFDWAWPNDEYLLTKGQVLFVRINNGPVTNALIRFGYCPAPYPLGESDSGHFRLFGVEEGITNPAFGLIFQNFGIHLDLCRNGMRLKDGDGLTDLTTCVGPTALAYFRKQLDDIDTWRDDSYFDPQHQPPVPPAWQFGSNDCPDGTFCGTHVFLMQNHRGAFSGPGYLSFPPAIAEPQGTSTDYARSDPAAYTLSTVAHETTHSFQHAACRAGITDPLHVLTMCGLYKEPWLNHPPFIGEPFTEGGADGPWVCLDDYHEPQPHEPCASPTRINRQRNWDAVALLNPSASMRSSK